MKLFNNMGKKGLAILTVACLSMGVSVNAAEVLKRDTVVAIEAMYTPTIGIYSVDGNDLILEDKINITNPSGGAAVGLAISTKNKLLFLSYEGSGTLDVINAETGEQIAPLTVPGTGNLSGIVVSESRNRLYTVNRHNTEIYVYDMKSDGNVTRMESEEFNATAGVVGIDVWGDRLYCTHYWDEVTVYDLNTKQKVDDYKTISSRNDAIAVDGSDSSNVMVYTTWTHQNSDTASILTQHNLNTGVEKYIDLGRDGRGLSVNPYYGFVYASTGDDYASTPPEARTYGETQFTTSQSNQPVPLGDVNLTLGGENTDILAIGVTYDPDVIIEITEPADKNVSMCNYVTFAMTVKNPSAEQALIVDGMEDNYDTTEMRFVESSVAPDDTTDDGNITWSNLNQLIAADGTWSFTKKFLALSQVNAAHETIRITDAELEDGTPVEFENTIYFDIAYSTAVCPAPPEGEVCCTPELQKRDSGSAFGTLSIIMLTMLTLLIGSLTIRRNSLKQS